MLLITSPISCPFLSRPQSFWDLYKGEYSLKKKFVILLQVVNCSLITPLTYF